MIAKDFILDKIDKHISEQSKDIYLVDLSIDKNNRISIELASKEGVSIDDCISLSKFIESSLDREIEDFELEVASAGISNPFKILRQYQDSIGQEIELLVKGGIKHKAILLDANESFVEIEIEKKIKLEGKKKKETIKETIKVDMLDILQAKRVISF